MNEENGVTRREALQGIAASAVVAGTSGLGLKESLAKGIEFDKNTVHEAQGHWVPVEKILELDVSYPENWQELLGNKTSGIIVNKEFHRFWVFVDGKMELSGAVATAGPDFDTPEGLYHFSRQESEAYVSGEYKSPMPSPTFIDAKDANGALRGIAIHGSEKFAQRNGVYQMKLDTSHGCMNISSIDAKKIQELLPMKTGHHPLYVMPSNNKIERKDEQQLLIQIKEIENMFISQDVLKVGTKEEINDLLEQIPSVPNISNLSPETARQVYSEHRHALPDAKDRGNDPVARLRSKNRLNPDMSPVTGNTVRIGESRALTSAHTLALMTGDETYLESIKEGVDVATILHPGFFREKHRETMRIQQITSMTDAEVHGSWSEAFGYSYDGAMWTPVRNGGFLLQLEGNGALQDFLAEVLKKEERDNLPRLGENAKNLMVYVTKSNFLLEAGTPVYARHGKAEFSFSAVISGSVDIGAGLQAYFVNGPDVLKRAVEMR